jgi:deoxycytidine triphosphate deaminase
MPLNRETIEALKLVRDFDPARFRDVGYDLTVGSIYVPRYGFVHAPQTKVPRTRIVTEFEIPPQGVVVVFSKETVVMPLGVCAYAMPKTSLCSDGILVFNTGIVDPEYRGPLSGTTVNFSDMPYTLKAGDPFLRLVFEEIAAPRAAPTPSTSQSFDPQERHAYEHDKIRIAQDFGATFLNVPATVKAVSEDVMNKERTFLLRAIAIIGMFLALAALVPSWIPREPPKDRLDQLAKEYSVVGASCVGER